MALKPSERVLFSLIELWIALRFRQKYRDLRRRLAAEGVRARPALPGCAEDKGLWRRVFDHDPRFVVTCDKLAAKEWVANRVRDVEIPQVLWQGTRASDIPADLPQQSFVLKANHGWRTNTFVWNGQPGYDEIVARAQSYLDHNHGGYHHKWGYFHIEKKVFCEELIAGGAPLIDMKIHPVGSDIVYFLCLADRFGKGGRCYWEPASGGGWKRSKLKPRDGSVADQSPLPASASKALDIASRLGAHFDYMRVDLLTDGDRVWFGELTAYPDGGLWPEIGHLPGHPLNLGWDLRRSWFLSTPQSGWRGHYARVLRRVLDRRSRHIGESQGGLPAERGRHAGKRTPPG